MANNDIPQYPFMFSPDQWANKFSPFQGKPIPFPAQYQGVPTDAAGNPIQSYLDTQAAHDAWNASHPAMPPSTTLNSGGGQTYGLQPSDLAGPSALNPSGNQAFGMATWGGMMSPQARQLYANQQFAAPGSARGTSYANPGGDPAYGPQQRSAAAQQNPYDMNAAYLAALQNPGKVQTPGANVAQSPPPSGQSGVLQQFLQNWKPGANPAGSYNPGLFPAALKGQV